MSLPTASLRVLFCLLVLASPALIAQAPVAPPARPRAVDVRAITVPDVRTWDRTIDQMIRSSQMIAVGSRPDPDIEGRRHESLVQVYQGIPVYGGGLSRQIERGVAVSILGTIFEGISIDPTPTLGPDEVVRTLVDETSGARLAGDAPSLLVFPTLGGGYRLAYRATMTDTKTYLVDALSGGVLWSTEVIKTQSQVGVGTGALGDSKKMSTTSDAGGFRTHDQLRPAPIRTFDTRGSEATLDRLLIPPGSAVDADFSVDADNTWVDPPVVDTHAHAGWFEDYLYKQVGWTGIDNRRSTITAAVHSNLINNAFFIGPPFGPDGIGMFVFGRSLGNAPLTSLDIVGHEMMHGVTEASLTQRTGLGILDALVIDRFGPTDMNFFGDILPCDTSTALLTDGRRLPFLCNAGRYVLASNHPGAIHEGFSDVFGIAAEFFHQPAGTGRLQADYKMGEDVAGFGPTRAADVPSSLIATGATGTFVPYPDHVSRMFTYLLAISQGTRTNPLAVVVLPWTLNGSNVSVMPSSDSAGVHRNSTILSHAFYLAIEGGRNATSGLTVQGVGAVNRAQVEKAFFRAMTLIMPNVPSLQTAAQATVLAASDLYGPNGQATLSIRQAMQAVGLVN